MTAVIMLLVAIVAIGSIIYGVDKLDNLDDKE